MSARETFGHHCGVCGERAALWKVVDGIEFTDCPECECIAMASAKLMLVDTGKFERQYDPHYWNEELPAARERSWGATLARAAEAILLCRRPVERFLDVASGPGYLLDSLNYYLPSSSGRFYGVERFPPAEHTQHSGFITGSVGELSGNYDCGVCIEVIEHLTPLMLRQLARELAWVSEPNSLFIFNTGLSEFVRQHSPEYIDPLRRGHIISWGFPALVEIFSGEGFKVRKLGTRQWAFAVEYLPDSDISINDRIWSPLDHNYRILNDPQTGLAMYIIARESLRAE